MRAMEDLLEDSVAAHGHLCPGQVLGVRLAMVGCREIGVTEPTEAKNLIVYVEIDRCAADAIQSVTGCRLGKRTLKHIDYGKMAATFVDLDSGGAVRVVAIEGSRDAVLRYTSGDFDKKTLQLQAYQVMPEEELFTVMPVRVDVPDVDLPGSPLTRVTCDGCGEGINDGRDILQGGRRLCRACVNGAYYSPIEFSPTEASPTMSLPVVTVVGMSNSGKTRVASALVRILTGNGYRVAAVKHCPHGYDIDRSGSDTDLLYRAGAKIVIGSAPGERFRRESTADDSPLESMIDSLNGSVDIVIGESFKASKFPCILVASEEQTTLAEEQTTLAIEGVIATVNAANGGEGIPVYRFDEMAELAAQLRKSFLNTGNL